MNIREMSWFFESYRRLNIFLLILGICPFLQSKRTKQFECSHKYLPFVAIYFAFFSYLGLYRLATLTPNPKSMVNILKLCRTVGSSYALYIVITFLIIYRRAHANFFNKIYEFDQTYSMLVKRKIKYNKINRVFWIEIIIFTIYLCIAFFVRFYFNEYFNDWQRILFWACEIGEQILYSFVIFHIKNCVWNLIIRFRQVNGLFKKTSSNGQLEKVLKLLNILLDSRDNMALAFGLALLLILIYNLFAVALSSYIMLYANVYELNSLKHRTHKHVYYITIKYFTYDLPFILKDFYLTLYFHILGNTVGRIQNTAAKIRIESNVSK